MTDIVFLYANKWCSEYHIFISRSLAVTKLNLIFETALKLTSDVNLMSYSEIEGSMCLWKPVKSYEYKVNGSKAIILISKN